MQSTGSGDYDRSHKSFVQTILEKRKKESEKTFAEDPSRKGCREKREKELRFKGRGSMNFTGFHYGKTERDMYKKS